jgi:uncharacterized protein YdaT
MKNLPAAVRNKAVEIANAMLTERGADEGIAIATGISRAKDWAAEHGKSIRPTRDSRTTDVKQHGQDRIVTPHEKGWAIKVEGRDRAEKTFGKKSEAVSAARKEAKAANATLTVQLKTGKVQSRTSYNPNNKGPKS